MHNISFSIIVVCLNPGEKLKDTLDSIIKQTYSDYEIVIKDGGSKDGSLASIPSDERIRLYTEKDTGIYDAMNQAVAHAEKDFVLFMNCGDVFHHDTVLEEIARKAEAEESIDNLILYGDTYGEKNDVLIVSPPEINGFTCYRNIPCHQSCFYATRLCKEKAYNPEYRVRADYDHFLWCYYVSKAKMVYTGIIIASYEGGGYSESKANRKRDSREHKEITSIYMSKSELFKYRAIMLCTLAPLRSFMAENKLLSGVYHKVKEKLYRKH